LLFTRCHLQAPIIARGKRNSFLATLITCVHAILDTLAVFGPLRGALFLNLSDLSADYFELIASCPPHSAVNLEPWVPEKWVALIKVYHRNNYYNSSPNVIASGLTHFGLPPAAQIFYLCSRRLFVWIGPFTLSLLSLMPVVCWLVWCIRNAGRQWRKNLGFFP
jgi:hypothetical protein